MKKTTFLIKINVTLFFVLFYSFNLFHSQTIEEPCAFDKMYQEKLKDPTFKKLYDDHNLMIDDYIKHNPSRSKSTIQIPVVVHVIHKGEAIGVGSNISDAQIQSAITNLNDVYGNKVNSSVSVDLGVQFQLAKRDTNCNSTTGIVRVNASGVPGYSQNGVNSSNTNGADETVLKDLSKWPTDQYMNFWIVSEIDGNNGGSGIQGYANLPVAIDEYNGAVMMASVFGYDPTGTLFNMSFNNDNSTVTHEVGHFLDLYHPFQGGSSGVCPPNETNCSTQGDKVCDTPPIMNYLNYNNNEIYFGCPIGTSNTCSTGNLDQVMHNIMNYTSCPDRFTAGQATRIQASLATSRLSLTKSLGLVVPSGAYTQPKTACASITTGDGLIGRYAGITEVVLNNLIKTSSSTKDDNPTNGYMDFTTSCLNVATVTAGQTYPLKITTFFNTQKVKAFIDYNNNGVFTDTGEELTTTGGLTSTSGAQVTQNITIPLTAVQNTSLRLRVISDITSVSGPCHTSVYGQTEDYTVLVLSSSPAASVAITSSDLDNSICTGTSVTFTAVANNGGAAPVYQWKLDGNVVGSNSTTYTTTGLTNNQIVTCVMTSNLVGVTASPATSNSITTAVKTTASPTGSAAQSVCNSGTVANLTATGTALKWYSASSGGSSLATNTALTNGTYYATQTVNTCESGSRLAVALTINTTSAPTGNASQTLCASSTVANLSPTGSSIKWYSGPTGGSSLATNTTLTNGTYYATQTLSSCESASRLAVTCSLQNTATPSGTSPQAFCTASTVANLSATGTSIKWYSTVSGGSSLATNTTLTSGTYYATQTLNSCESSNRLAVVVTSGSPSVPTGSATQSVCNSGTVANLSATGTAIKWYSGPTGGSSLTANTALANGTYYATQTVNTCESATRLAVTLTINTSAAPTGSNSQTFCATSTVAKLSATGSSIKWYSVVSGGSSLATNTTLTNGTYYATQTLSSCESASRLTVSVTINQLPVVTFSPIPNLCTYSPLFTLTQGLPSGIGGVYSGIGVSNGVLNPSLLSIGSTNLTYTYTDSKNCTSSSQTSVTVSQCLGIDELDKSGFVIFPNPTTNLFYINSMSEEIQNIVIYNNQGEIVKSKFLNLENLKYSIELDSCSEGIYLVQVKTKSSLYYSKLSIIK